jgi:hypothetical protein
MTLALRDYLFIFVLLTLCVMVILWGVQKRRADSLEAYQDQSKSLQKQEKVLREYIPMRLDEKCSDELTEIGAKLWGE